MSDGADPPGGDPYRSAGRGALGAVRHRFVAARRPRYLGSANAVARARPLSPGGLILPASGRAPALPEGRRSPTDVIEICDGGLRVRTAASVLELTWDQVVGVHRVEGPAGLLAVVVRGAHGEELTVDRTIRNLDQLAALLGDLAGSGP